MVHTTVVTCNVPFFKIKESSTSLVWARMFGCERSGGLPNVPQESFLCLNEKNLFTKSDG